MFCKKCGKEIDDNSIFCTQCGYKFNDQSDGNTQRPSFAFEFFFLALAILLIGIGAYNLVLVDETLNSFNGISIREVPRLRITGWTCMIPGVTIAAISVISMIKKLSIR